MNLARRFDRCDREIAEALAATELADHTLAKRIGILIWEMDWRSERKSILAEAAMREPCSR
jgi:hypothetical protein